MTKTCLCSAILVIASTLIGTGAAVAAEPEPTLSHPADPSPIPGRAAPSSAFDLAVPMIDRPAAHPSYGPTPADGIADPVDQMDQMMEMDHSAHQMPDMDMNNMPGMNHDTPPENSQ